MVRKCAVENCSNTDATTIAHRFPRKKQLADQWRKSLNLQRFALTDLISKYVVCTQHFIASDYRHCESNFLNFTAIPKLTSNDLLPPTTSNQKVLKSVPLTFASVQLQQKRRRAKLKQLNQKSKIIAATTSQSVLPKTIVTIPIKPLDDEEEIDEYTCDQDNEVEDVLELFDEIEDPVKIIDTPFTLGELHENATSTTTHDIDENDEVEIIDELPYYEEEMEQDEDEHQISDNTNCQSSSALKSPSPQFVIRVESITVDASVSTDDIMENEITDSNRDYVHLSKLELIQKLIGANEKITELETDLVKMKASQKEMNDKMAIIQQLIRN